MKTSQDILSSVLKTTQMGQVGIRSVLRAPMSDNLRRALHSQLKEYDAIETEAHNIAKARGWELSELNSAVRFMSNAMSSAKLSFQCNDSKVAAMMVQGNTRGVIKGLKHEHRYDGSDQRVSDLSQKLLNCENENILQMEQYL